MHVFAQLSSCSLSSQPNISSCSLSSQPNNNNGVSSFYAMEYMNSILYIILNQNSTNESIQLLRTRSRRYRISDSSFARESNFSQYVLFEELSSSADSFAWSVWVIASIPRLAELMRASTEASCMLLLRSWEVRLWCF